MSTSKDDAADLIQRLVVADGRTLRITDPDDEVRASYRRCIHAAKQRKLVPEGTVLRHTGRAAGDLVIRLLDAQNPDETDWNRIRLNLRKPTRVAQDLRTLLAENPSAMRVSDGQRDRAIAFLLALDAESAKCGHQVRMARRGQHAKLAYVIGGTQKSLELSEEYEDAPRAPSTRRGLTTSWPSYGTERVASGRLRLEIGRTGHAKNGYPNCDTWTDNPRATLEKKTRTIVREAQTGFDADEAQRLEAERQRAEQRAEWERQQEAARIARENKEAETRRAWRAALDEARPRAAAAVRHATLMDALHAWRDARDLREICAILEGSAGIADQSGEAALAANLRKWCEGGLALADSVDPTTGPASIGELAYDRDPSADELRPFLNGWSPEAPRKEEAEQRPPQPPRAGPADWYLGSPKQWYPGRKPWW